MTWMRGAVVTAALAGALAGCGGGGHATGDASIEQRAAGGRDGGEADGGADAPSGVEAGVDAARDLATDFGGTEAVDGGPCPASAGALAAAPADLLIDDFDGSGPLNGRQRTNAAFVVKEQFDATAGATFSPAPAVDGACGAAAPGAAHIKGRAADTGATFALVFSVPQVGGKPVDHYDASGTRGLSVRFALGSASASRIVTLRVNLAGSQWDYTKDLTVGGTTWQTVTVLWSELESAPGADPFAAAKLNQIVLPFFADTDVDLYVDDVAFVK